MRRVLAMLLVLEIAACHAPPSPPIDRQATPAFDDVSAGDLFYDWFRTNIARHCGTTLSGTVARDECVKTMLLSAFDESGQARKDCRRDSELGWFGECVIYGSFARELLVARNPQMTIDLNWRAAKSSFAMVIDKTIASEVNAACSGSKLETMHVCQRQQLAKSLGLSSDSARVCGSWKVDNWRLCVLNEYFSKELAEASAQI